MKNQIVYFVFLAGLFLSGCASTYVAPSEGPLAKIRFINDYRGNQQITGSVVLARADLGSCSQDGHYERQIVLEVIKDDLLHGNRKEVSPIQMMGTSGVAEANIRERVIEAGKLFPFDIWSTYLGIWMDYGVYKQAPKYTCIVFGSFAPDPSGEYEVKYKNSVGQNSGCSAEIYKLNMGPRGEVVRTLDTTQRYYRDKDFCQAR